MPSWAGLSLRVVTLIIMLVGLFGLIVPIFPGIVVIWLAALGYGVVVGFSGNGVWVFAVLTALMLVGAVVDNVLMARGARSGGAAWYSILLAIAAGIAATYIYPPFGGLLAAPVVLLLFELLHQRDLAKAWRATRGYLVGCGWAFVIRFAIGLTMVALWLVFWA